MLSKSFLKYELDRASQEGVEINARIIIIMNNDGPRMNTSCDQQKRNDHFDKWAGWFVIEAWEYGFGIIYPSVILWIDLVKGLFQMKMLHGLLDYIHCLN